MRVDKLWRDVLRRSDLVAWTKRVFVVGLGRRRALSRENGRRRELANAEWHCPLPQRIESGDVSRWITSMSSKDTDSSTPRRNFIIMYTIVLKKGYVRLYLISSLSSYVCISSASRGCLFFATFLDASASLRVLHNIYVTNMWNIL